MRVVVAKCRKGGIKRLHFVTVVYKEANLFKYDHRNMKQIIIRLYLPEKILQSKNVSDNVHNKYIVYKVLKLMKAFTIAANLK